MRLSSALFSLFSVTSHVSSRCHLDRTSSTRTCGPTGRRTPEFLTPRWAVDKRNRPPTLYILSRGTPGCCGLCCGHPKAAFHHVITLPPVAARRELGQVMERRQLIGPMRPNPAPHCQLGTERSMVGAAAGRAARATPRGGTPPASFECGTRSLASWSWAFPQSKRAHLAVVSRIRHRCCRCLPPWRRNQ